MCWRDLSALMFSSKVFLEELVRSNLSALPLMKYLLTPARWQEEECMN